MNLIEARDREFYRRIEKNRVDPTAQSATNPVPDFYGVHLALSSPILRVHIIHGRYRRENRFHPGLQTGESRNSQPASQSLMNARSG
jgi:import inner membrane translocase subunit TIM23